MHFYVELAVKMLNDNGLSPNDVPNTGQIIMWDETQVLDQSTQSVINANKTIYATLLGYGTPEQVNPISKMYKDTLNVSYTATDPAGETLITITALQNNEVIQIQKEIQKSMTPMIGKCILWRPESF